MAQASSRFVSSAIKHRPGRFSDVLAQDHVSRTLAHGLELGRVANAYLFSGPRGTGKTTMARVLAKALNCEQPNGVEPCGKCPQCRAIANGTHPDILEMDAASNRGVEEIEDLRENVRFSPSIGKKKVYIIDEVHMLTAHAFNALLKTLEEPPTHSTFILATTELHKVPETIRSRCQRFQMRRIPAKIVVDRLKEVLEAEGGISFASEKDKERVLYHVARTANGGLRDALVALDQIIAFAGENLQATEVEDLLGVVDLDALEVLAGALWQGDLPAVVKTIGALVDRGREPVRILAELTAFLRHLLVVKITGGEELVDLPEDVLNELRASVEDVGVERLLMVLEVLVEAEDRMRYSAEARLVLEVACLKAAKLGETVALADILAKLGGAPPPPSGTQSNRTPTTVGPAASTPQLSAPVQTLPKAAGDHAEGPAFSDDKVVSLPVPGDESKMVQPTSKLERIIAAWPQILDNGVELPPLLESAISVAKPVKIIENRIVVSVPRVFRKLLVPLQNAEYQERIIQNLQKLVGETFCLEAKLDDELTPDEVPVHDIPPARQEELEQIARNHEAVKQVLAQLPGVVVAVRTNQGGKRK